MQGSGAGLMSSSYHSATHHDRYLHLYGFRMGLALGRVPRGALAFHLRWCRPNREFSDCQSTTVYLRNAR